MPSRLMFTQPAKTGSYFPLWMSKDGVLSVCRSTCMQFYPSACPCVDTQWIYLVLKKYFLIAV